MHAALRVSPFVFGACFAITSLAAQSPQLPPIFAPKPLVSASEVIVARPPATSGTISNRMRALITERALANGKADETASAASTGAESKQSEVTADGALLMQRFVVKSVGPSQDEVKPPDLPLYHFAPSSRVDRRVKSGYSATLLRFFGGAGSVNVGVVNGAGQGIDHSIDFTRVELGLSLRW